MTTSIEAQGAPTGDLYHRVDMSPELIFQAIGKLRREAQDEIDKLIAFLDRTDEYVQGEQEENGDEQDQSFRESSYFAGVGAVPMEDDEDADPDEDSDPAEYDDTGIADRDGLLEQCGNCDGYCLAGGVL